MTLVYLVQHAEKRPDPGDPDLTDLGREQAARTALWFRDKGISAVYSSPLRRAVQTARHLAETVVLDSRLRERMNWDGRQPLAEFLTDWDRATRDRDFVPSSGDSSHQAAARMIAFLRSLDDAPGPVAAVTHGGATTDLLRTLLDEAVPPSLMDEGVPSCAITTLSGLQVLQISGAAGASDAPVQ